MSCSNRRFEQALRTFLGSFAQCYDNSENAARATTSFDETYRSCPYLDLDEYDECEDDNFLLIPYRIASYAGVLALLLCALFAYYVIKHRRRSLDSCSLNNVENEHWTNKNAEHEELNVKRMLKMDDQMNKHELFMDDVSLTPRIQQIDKNHQKEETSPSTKSIHMNGNVKLTKDQHFCPKSDTDNHHGTSEFLDIETNIQIFIEFLNKFSGSIDVESKIQSVMQFESLEAEFPDITSSKGASECRALALSVLIERDCLDQSSNHSNELHLIEKSFDDNGNADYLNKTDNVDNIKTGQSVFRLEECTNVALSCEIIARYESVTKLPLQSVVCTIFNDKQKSSTDYFAVVKKLSPEKTFEADGHLRPWVPKNDDSRYESFDVSAHLRNKFGDNGCTCEILLANNRENGHKSQNRLVSLRSTVKVDNNVVSRSDPPNALVKLQSETEDIGQPIEYEIAQNASVKLNDANSGQLLPNLEQTDFEDSLSAEYGADNTTAPDIDTVFEADMDNVIVPEDDNGINLPEDYQLLNCTNTVTENEHVQRDCYIYEADALQSHSLWEKEQKSRSHEELIEGDVEVKATVFLSRHCRIFTSQEECNIIVSEEDKDSSQICNVNSVLGLFNTNNCEDVIHRLDTLEAVTDIMRKAGLESSNLIFGIDYTASNKYQGDSCFNGKSLHSIESDVLNPYQQVITILGKTLVPFISEEGFLTAYGFGDATTTDQSVFPLRRELFCSSFEEILKIYNSVTPTVTLGGPTNFAPLIRGAMDLCKKLQEYHILVIVADGQVTNERATRKAIVEACRFPLSIIVVGVGDGPWDMMRVFDEMLPKRPWDNFHFIEFNEIVAKYGEDGNFETAFAVQSLLEIPDQYKVIKEMGLLNFDDDNESV